MSLDGSGCLFVDCASASGEPAQCRDQRVEAVDHCVRAQILRGLVAIAVACRDHRHACRARSHHVVGTVADEGQAPRPAPLHRSEDWIGGGLGAEISVRILAQTVPADQRHEAVGQIQLLENLGSEAFELVGHHRQLHIHRRQLVQRLEHAGEGLRVDRVVLRVIPQQRLIERAVVFLRHAAALGFDRAGEHHLCAAADQTLNLLGRHLLVAAICQRVVYRRGKVCLGVEQRAVEIEAYRIKGKIAHAGLRGETFFNLQADGGTAPHMTDFAAIILAAGKGTRMKSDLHKVLHPIAGRAMLHHLMASIDTLGPKRKVVVVGAGRDQLEAALGDDAETRVQEPQLGTGHAVQQAEEPLGDFTGDVLVLYGDVPFVRGETMRAMLDRLHAEDAPKVVVLGFEPEDALAYGRVIADDEGRISKMVEFKDANEEERACTLCNSGLMAARAADMFDLLRRVGNDNAQGEYYLPDIVNIAIADGDTCAAVTASDPGEVAGINSRAELARAEAQWQELKREEAMANGATLRAPETVFFSYDTQIGRDVTIDPNVVFGPGVRVADGAHIKAFSHLEGATVGEGAQVGPYARLRPGAVLERDAFVGNFVEMKKSTLGQGAKASHLTYLGDAEIGAGANIGAGTITCNYDGYFKYKTTIGERAFIGSNSALVAPVTIGADAIVAAGSTVTRDVAPGELRMERAEQSIKPGWADRFHDTMKKKKRGETK